MIRMADVQNQMEQNTFVYLMTNPDGSFKTDRIIISKSQSYPKIFTLKIIGSELVSSFTPIFDLDYSKSVEPDKVSQIIGAVSIFKITPDLYAKITANSDLSDMNVVLDSSKQAYGLIKRFLLTNPENLTNTFNEVVAYVDTYIKTQLRKYEITDDAFITDINVAMFLMLSGKQKVYQPGVTEFIAKQASNSIPQSQLRTQVAVEETKKGFFSFLHKPSTQNQPEIKSNQPKIKPKQPKIKAKDNLDLSVERDIAKAEKDFETPEKTGFLKAAFQKWKEDAWESPEEHKRRVDQKNSEIEDKLKLERERLDLISRKNKLKKEMSEGSKSQTESENTTDNSAPADDSEEQD